MSTNAARLDREIRTIRAMFDLFCLGRHGAGPGLCASCGEVLAYAEQRIDRCPHGDEKPSCAKCEIHCFQAEMRKRIREVMRYAGPRMLLRHPILTVRHYLDSRRDGSRQHARRMARALGPR
jgi:hypothetical protein